MALRHPFAVQLYSARKFPPLESQIAVVARCGFTHVETFGPLNQSPDETRRALDRHGLVAVSAHISVNELESDASAVVRAAHVLGVEFVVAPYLSPEKRPKDRAGWIALGQRLARTRDVIERASASRGTTTISNSNLCPTAATRSSIFSARTSLGRPTSPG